MFPKKERVKRTDFAIVLKEGRNIVSQNLNLRYVELNKDAASNSHYSFVVPAKVAKLAVRRNLLKRRARYVIRKLASKIKKSFLCVFFFKLGADKINFLDLEREIVDTLSKAKIL